MNIVQVVSVVVVILVAVVCVGVLYGNRQQSRASSQQNVRKMVRAAMIAAVYVALCLVLAPISYGPIQVRISEALTLLPVICPEAVIGVTLGCFLANTISGVPIDMVVGTLATLLAALATRKLRHARWKGLPIAASLPPIVFNAVIVGVELTVLFSPAGSAAAVYLANMASVGIGQIISCGILGVLLVWVIEKNKNLYRLFSDTPLQKAQ